MNKLHAFDLSVGVTASRVNENHHGPWRNVRLHLTFAFGDRTEISCASPGHDYRFGPGLYDHLVIQDLDVPSDEGMCVPRYGVEEYPHDDDGQIGHLEYSEHVSCVPWDHCPDPDVECDTVIVGYSWLADADVYVTLPSCGRFRIHYLLDGKEWSRFCTGDVDTPGVAEVRTIIMGSSRINHGCAKVDSNLLAYIYSLEPIQKAFADIDMGTCPEPPPPPGDATAEFIGYIKPNGSDGRNWFPSPGDSIGLVFRINIEPPGSRYDIAYHIWDMTMWRGECMNSPVYLSTSPVMPDTAGPMPTGYEGAVTWQEIDTFRHWDFTVGKPSQYNFFVRDVLTYVARAPVNPWPVWGDTLRNLYPLPEFDLSQARPLFRTLIVASKKSEASADTLWLKARDYAAHCLVTPEIGGGKDRRIRPFLSPYNQELRTITVPYDYDGYRDIGLNYGDCMPDRWEEAEFPTQDIRKVRPFVTITSQAGPTKADLDAKPKGRGFDGDLFCNFAEYRGLMVAVDSMDTHAGHRHQRLDPQRKTVILHVRENMGDDFGGDSVLSQMPGYIYKLQQPSVQFHDTVEIYFTDSIRFRREPTHAAYGERQEQIERTRFIKTGRDVNFNRSGAGLWYYGFGAPISYPMSSKDTIRAVTYWRWTDDTEGEFYRSRNANTDHFLGTTMGVPVFAAHGDTAFVPNKTVRMVVNMPNYNRIRDEICGGDTPRWRQDFPRECKRTIAHEFGHTVGMFHPVEFTSRTIMSEARLQSHVFLLADSVYSDSSKSEFSIKER